MNPVIKSLRSRRRALELTQASLSVALGEKATFIGKLEGGMISAKPGQIAAIDRALKKYEDAQPPKVGAPKVSP